MSVRSTYRFARTPEWVLFHPDLNGTDVRVFGALDRFDGRDCIPAVPTVAERLGVSRDTVERAIRSLEAVGAVRREQRFTDEGRQTSNRYILAGDEPLPPASADSRGSSPADSRTTTSADFRDNPEQEDLEQEEPSLAVAVARPRNELWDALDAELGSASTPTECKLRGKAVKELKAAGATAQDVHVRCAEYRLRWPSMALTETALIKHWSAMGTETPRLNNVSPGMAKLRRMMAESRNGDHDAS